MPRNFNLDAIRQKLKLPGGAALSKDPRFIMRVVLGVLLVANLVAAVFVFRPMGGSAEELDARVIELRNQVQQRRVSLERLKSIAAKVDKGRKEGDNFLSSYFLDRRSAGSTLVAEISSMAKLSGIRPKEHAFAFDLIDGSDTLGMMTITANYEGTYADLVKFVNQLDRSPRFVIIESLAAAPQQSTGILNVALKLNVFIREQGAIPPSGATVNVAQAKLQGGAQ